MKKHLALVPALAAALTLSLAACSSSNVDTSATDDTADTTSTPSAGATPDGSGRGGGGFPGASGEVAAVQGDVLQVQSAAQGQVAVTLTGTTTVTAQAPSSLEEVAVGSCVVVIGAGTTVRRLWDLSRSPRSGSPIPSTARARRPGVGGRTVGVRGRPPSGAPATSPATSRDRPAGPAQATSPATSPATGRTARWPRRSRWPPAPSSPARSPPSTTRLRRGRRACHRRRRHHLHHHRGRQRRRHHRRDLHLRPGRGRRRRRYRGVLHSGQRQGRRRVLGRTRWAASAAAADPAATTRPTGTHHMRSPPSHAGSLAVVGLSCVLVAEDGELLPAAPVAVPPATTAPRP